eukprot:TRINITY_DN47285_c0_g1_i1.p1 TRINITY_DN47285_c0_g1~~TRINITY_DN47285_c0_g1_i1.p1  ORF type:complete len:273 (+),score=22.58 TRINITY_DN47285_c0_g1_i1:118-819(+)
MSAAGCAGSSSAPRCPLCGMDCSTARGTDGAAGHVVQCVGPRCSSSPPGGGASPLRRPLGHAPSPAGGSVGGAVTACRAADPGVHAFATPPAPLGGGSPLSTPETASLSQPSQGVKRTASGSARVPSFRTARTTLSALGAGGGDGWAVEPSAPSAASELHEAATDSGLGPAAPAAPPRSPRARVPWVCPECGMRDLLSAQCSECGHQSRYPDSKDLIDPSSMAATAGSVAPQK